MSNHINSPNCGCKKKRLRNDEVMRNVSSTSKCNLAPAAPGGTSIPHSLTSMPAFRECLSFSLSLTPPILPPFYLSLFFLSLSLSPSHSPPPPARKTLEAPCIFSVRAGQDMFSSHTRTSTPTLRKWGVCVRVGCVCVWGLEGGAVACTFHLPTPSTPDVTHRFCLIRCLRAAVICVRCVNS